MITVTITRQTLTAAEVCDDGLALYDSIKRDQDALRTALGKRPCKHLHLPWTPLAQVWLAVAHPGFFRWLYDQGIVPMLTLRRADLRGTDLSGADLYGADLYGADLYGADLGDWKIENDIARK